MQKNLNKINISFIGDSHTTVWNYIKKQKLINERINISQVISVAAKSAQGLSKKINRNMYIKRLDFTDLNYIGLNFGEVDCAYSMWSRMQRDKTSFKKEIEFASEQIINMASILCEETDIIPIIIAPIIPIVASYKEGEYTKRVDMVYKPGPGVISRARELRERVPLDHKERTKIVLRTQSRLSKLAKENKFKFLTINDILYNKETKVAKEEYQNLGGGWHLKQKVAAPLWASKLEGLI